MISRNSYLKQLHDWKDQDLIKVITGIRRCGKSTLLELFQVELRKAGVSSKHIIAMNFEDPKYTEKLDWRETYNLIDAQLADDEQHYYIFLDEVQNIPEFEKMADGLYIKKNVDLYLTGSNAYFMSSDLATLLTGRYIEIKMYPLSFMEFVSGFGDKSQSEALFSDYLEYGGFPRVVELLQHNRDLISEYLEGIYYTIVNKDVISRNGVTDEKVLHDVAKYMLDNVGNITSAKKIADTMTSAGRRISHNTVTKYIEALAESFLFYEVNKIGVKGKKRLYLQKKHYAVDTGMRQSLLGLPTGADRGHVLENVVYFELLRRKPRRVEVGKVDDNEVDFVVLTQAGETQYYQVTETMTNEEIRVRELKPLRRIADNHHKFVLTMDRGEFDHDGIRQLNLLDWLLAGK